MSSWVRTFPLREGEDETQFKLRFAELWARYPWENRTNLILTILPGEDNMGRALLASELWPADIEVLAELEKLKTTALVEDGEEITQDSIIREVLNVARKANNADHKVKAYKLIAEIAGWVVKAGPGQGGDVDTGGDLLEKLEKMLPN